MKELYDDIGVFNSIYRGFVVWNDDPLVEGRLKIFVPGVYSDNYVNTPELLPWANPAMSPFGGNSINLNYKSKGLLNDETGWSSPPHAGDVETGAQVYVFFENGDINYPVYFAFAQSGKGWLSEHPNQHVFKSDNVRIRIDENVDDERSTCKFDSYNSKNSKVSKTNLERDCTKHGWSFDQEKGNIKQLKTRIDIEVLADNLNAINLNIHGNVNMRLDGNWFVEHYGNKYEYHEGDTYIKQIGSTYIEQEGKVVKFLTGDKKFKHTGHYTLTHTGDTEETHTGFYIKTVDGDVRYLFNSEYKLTVGKNYTEVVKANKRADISGDKTLRIIQGTYTEIIAKNKFMSAEGTYDCFIGESITSKSKRGNILLETEGEFELMKDGKITPKGFSNIGTRGNIQVISTFGNINIQCKKNNLKADFNQKCVVIPWNPSFVVQLDKLAANFPEFNKVDSILGAEALNTQFSIDDVFNIDKFVQLFKEFTSSLLIYDGLPVFLPTRMIVQNPNIPIPNNADDCSWVPDFRSEASNWKNISDSDYWKLPGRLMGNINIETWSGDINIKTNSELGCAGNINIEATESAGTLPGYKIGTVNIKNSGEKRIYPDPRDLFLDSDFQSRMAGQFKLFKHATNYLDLSWRRSVLPTVADSILRSFTGCSFEWVGTNYDDFYQLNGLAFVTRGKMGPLSPIEMEHYDEIKDKRGPKLGCTKCISDYLLGLPGVQDACYAAEPLSKFASDGLHSYGFYKFNPFDRDNPRGTFNISSLNFNKLSMGDGHAIDMGFIDREFTGPNIGAFNLNTSGDFNQKVGRNYSFKSNTDYKEGTKSISYTYTEEWYDYVWPSALKLSIQAINTLWNSTLGKIVTIKDGDLIILSGLKFVSITIPLGFYFLDFPLPENKILTLGKITTESESLGKEITFEKSFGYRCTVDFGFSFETDIKKFIENPKEIFKVNTLKFTDEEFNYSIIKDSEKYEKYEKTNREFSLKLSDPYDLKINVIDSYKNSKIFQENYDVRTGMDEFLFTWNLNNSQKLGIPIPDFYWKTTDDLSIKQGHGHTFSQSFISYKAYNASSIDEIKMTIEPYETYVDFKENMLKTVFNTGFGDGTPRNISIENTCLAKRSIKKNVTWKSAINTNIFTLNSVGYFHDETAQKDISVNNITVKMIGNMDVSDDEFSIIKKNEFIFDANNFKNNKIFINNGPSGFVNESLNKIEVNNGNGTKQSINEIFINNGKEVSGSTNNIKFENGTDESGENTNRYLIKNGFGTFTSSTYDIYNGNENTSLKFYVDKNSSTITEYSLNTKISNIGILEQKNVGQTQNIKIGKTQTLDIGETQNTIIGTTKTIDVPSYNFNTINMIMNNKKSTSINTEVYSLNCSKTCSITVIQSYTLTAGIITTTALTAYSNTAGATYSIKAGAAVSILAVGAGTFNAGGTVSVGSANPKGATNITGLFNATGYLTGHSTWAASAGSAPEGGSSPNNPKEGPGGTSASVSVPTITPVVINNPAKFPGIETPKTPYLFTKLLQLYVEYLKEEFNYLINIFK